MRKIVISTLLGVALLLGASRIDMRLGQLTLDHIMVGFVGFLWILCLSIIGILRKFRVPEIGPLDHLYHLEDPGEVSE
ncbi:unnamed protein product [marine sediment metagenome]|uniref:Uncharacterized protein n=1 Tax=marine sediment metagenome TaxID=412755 RepID=X1NFV2_9ZZZZ